LLVVAGVGLVACGHRRVIGPRTPVRRRDRRTRPPPAIVALHGSSDSGPRRDACSARTRRGSTIVRRMSGHARVHPPPGRAAAPLPGVRRLRGDTARGVRRHGDRSRALSSLTPGGVGSPGGDRGPPSPGVPRRRPAVCSSARSRAGWRSPSVPRDGVVVVPPLSARAYAPIADPA
jgi:hypothetical protein